MKKHFYLVLGVLALLLLLLVSCTADDASPKYNAFAFDGVSVSASYSRDAEKFETVFAHTPLFKHRIYADGSEETVYLRLQNEEETFVRVSLDIGAVGGVTAPKDLFYGYAEERSDHMRRYPIGEEGRETFILSPGEALTLVLSVGTEEEDIGLVAPLLGLTLHAEPMTYAFDTENAQSYELLSGKEANALLPKKVKSIVFSDRADPRGVALSDLSAGQNGAVVGWEEDGVYIISTRVKGKSVLTGDNAAYLFADLVALEHIDLSMLDTSKTRDFMRFFSGCSSLTEVDLSLLDTASAVRTRSMFNGCASLTVANIAAWDVASVVDAAYMFAGTGSLSSLDLSAWDLSRAVYTTAMFQSSGIRTLSLPSSLSVVGSLFFNHTARYAEASLRLPASLVSVGRAHAFYNFGTDAFTSFETEEGCEGAKATDGVLYSADGKVLLALPKGKRFEDAVFEIAEGTELLGELSFSRNPYVKTVLLPNSYRVKVYTEKHHADFADANGTGNLNVGNSLNLAIYVYTGVEQYAVKEDNPVYLTHDGALYTKNAQGRPQTLIALPVGFRGALMIPEGVEAIAAEALWEDAEVIFSGLSEVCIPASLTDIPGGQLAKLNSLGVTLTVAEDNPAFAVGEDGRIIRK